MNRESQTTSSDWVQLSTTDAEALECDIAIVQTPTSTRIFSTHPRLTPDGVPMPARVVTISSIPQLSVCSCCSDIDSAEYSDVISIDNTGLSAAYADVFKHRRVENIRHFYAGTDGAGPEPLVRCENLTQIASVPTLFVDYSTHRYTFRPASNKDTEVQLYIGDLEGAGPFSPWIGGDMIRGLITDTERGTNDTQVTRIIGKEGDLKDVERRNEEAEGITEYLVGVLGSSEWSAAYMAGDVGEQEERVRAYVDVHFSVSSEDQVKKMIPAALSEVFEPGATEKVTEFLRRLKPYGMHMPSRARVRADIGASNLEEHSHIYALAA